MIRFLIAGMIVSLTIAATGTSANGQDIDFIERFALSSDREATLSELVPGTDAYYFYNCLHFQNTQRFDQAAEILKTWEKRRGRNDQVRQMQHRQALLIYGDTPDATVEYLIDQLNIKFNHQRRQPSAEPGLASALDQSLISFERLNKRALSRNNTNRYEDIALFVAATQELKDSQLRSLLERLRHPSVPDLPKLVVRDLNRRDSKSFGSYAVHNMMTLDQLDELVKLRPKLRNEVNFVNNYLLRLAPGNDVFVGLERDENVAYLDRLWSFVSDLNPSHNSLKACVLFHRLELDRQMGVYDKQRFVEYLKLPRQAYYVREKMLEDVRSRNLVNFGANFQAQTRLQPINMDEPLVRHLLHHFLVDSEDWREFETWITDDYLKERFAEAHITAGLGDAEQWASMLSPSKYQELMKRIDLEFAYTNPYIFQVEDKVEIRLTTKNIKNLIVKVFEINTANFYRNNSGEIDTDINLDGLVPNWQKTFDYDQEPIQRVERTFTFDEIDHRGVFIVDFIGSGQSSRVMIRKGHLHHFVETTSAGHQISVVDEKHNLIKDASLWSKGRQYQPDENGRFMVPFTNQPRRESLIMEHDGLSVRGQFNHQAENYELKAGIHVDRESLLRMGKANVIVRPQLQVAGQPAPVKLLEKVRLVVRATDLDGVEVTKEFSGIELAEEFETSVEIMIPARLRTIQFELFGQVEVLSKGEPQQLAARQAFNVNGIDTTQTLQAVHLRQNDQGYMLAVRGKTGESRNAQAVQLKLKHRWFTDAVSVSLQSDAKGQIALGALKNISWVEASLNGQNTRKWFLENSDQTSHGSINASTGQTIEIAYDTNLQDTKLVLLELRGDHFYGDHSDNVSMAEGLISIKPLPAGDYQLLNKRDGHRQLIRVTEGDKKGTYVLGKWRTLEIRNPRPLHVKDIEVAEDKVRIKLGGNGELSRVHVIATRYQPRFDAFGELSSVGDVEPMVLTKGFQLSGYVAGRSIGEEYQYILERQFKEKYPGNMLTRPSLILNPWALRDTENNVQVATAGEAFGQGGASAPGSGKRDRKGARTNQPNSDFANLDFLVEGSVLLANLVTDENGVLEIDRELFGDKHMLQIVVQNPFHTLVRNVNLPEKALRYRDLRLADGLDPERHFAQQKQYTVLKAGEEFKLEDISSARFQQYDDLTDIYRYYVTLTGNSQLIEFGFLMDWPNKSDDEKLELYKRYACHEFNFFLMKKDPDYFVSAIVPYLENKFHKTFLDDYLLEMKLESWGEPWEFQRLNTLEQILLGRRIDGHRQRLDQRIGDDYDNNPTSRRVFDRYYDFAVVGNALESDGKNVEMRERFKDSRKNEVLSEDLAMSAIRSMPDEQESPPVTIPSTANALPESARRGATFGGGEQQEKLRDELSRADDDALYMESDASKSVVLGRGLSDGPVDMNDQAGGDFARSSEGEGGGRGRRFRNEIAQKKRKATRQFFQRIKPTQEWVENNYYRLPIEQQNSQLVRVNRFWRDYALHTGKEPFLSPFFAESSRNFTEMMLALSVIDLPFEADEHEVNYDENSMTMTPKNNLIAFYEQVRASAFDRGETTVLVSENFFRSDDRYRTVDGKARERFVRKEFLSNVLYGGQIVITNPTATPQEIDLLVQIPEGALPANGSHETKTKQMDMAAFSTQTLEYFFYFPTPGDFGHFPAHVSVDSATVAMAEGLRFNVVESLSEIDTESWAYISQNGSEEQVIDYLEKENLMAIDLGQIAFRMKSEGFYGQVTELLTQRFAYNNTLWSYSLKHNDQEDIGQFLQHQDSFVISCGTYLKSPVLKIEPVIRHMYQHREYWPLVNARAHRLGNDRKILNNAIWQQYHQLLQIVARQNKPADEEHLAITYYLLLQDRITEAMEHFGKVSADKIETRLQYDYCAAYIAMYQDQPQQADQIAKRYADHPVKRWRELFAAVSAQVKEINGGANTVVDVRDQNQRQTELAANTPGFEFVVEALTTKLKYQNLDEVTINYYQMDVELLFSRNPFVQRQDDSFAMIKPNATEIVKLPEDKKAFDVKLPEQFLTSNVLVEVVGGGKTERQAYYANSMDVQTIEQYGQVKVTKAEAGDLLSKVYVKVYARKADGSIHFYKDGYTDLRGRFDYVSLSNQNLNDVNRFSILVISPDHGAVVREAEPPKQ